MNLAKGKMLEWLEEDKLLLIEGWARNGLTNEQIANNIGINVKTLYDWINKSSNISNALKKGKEVVDIEVENALLKRALGYTITLHKQKLTKEGEVVDVAEETHIPGDTTAQIFWLKNRKPEQWREKVVDTDNEEAIANATNILVKIRKTIDDRYDRE